MEAVFTGIFHMIRAVLHYRKAVAAAFLTAVAGCVLAGACFLMNPKKGGDAIPSGGSGEEASALPDEKETSAPQDGADTEAKENVPGAADEGTDAGNAAPGGLKDAVETAILTEYADAYPDSSDFECCDFVFLDTISEQADDGTERVTCYGWAMHMKYLITEKGIADAGGSHIPIALTFEKAADGYVLMEFLQPRDGSYYAPDIREKFPAHIAEDGIDSQKYVLQQMQNCYRQTVAACGVDTDAVIEALLEEICSEPSASSNPWDYVAAHEIECRELMFCGEDTLRYCISRFQKGGETGLPGSIMALVCEELLQTEGTIADARTAENGQIWFDTLYAHASNIVEPYFK